MAEVGWFGWGFFLEGGGEVAGGDREDGGKSAGNFILSFPLRHIQFFKKEL